MPDEVGVDPEVFHGIEVAARVERRLNQVFVHIDIEGKARLECDRTLREFDQPLQGSFRILFTEEDDAVASDNYDDVRVWNPEDQQVDIADAVRDTLILAVPLRKVAPGAEEEAIPSEFGQPDESEPDHRWEALRKLASDGGGTPTE